jgi:hypothetical protein
MALDYRNITPLDPAVEAAWKARAEIFFAECRAVHDADVKRKVDAILAAERANLPMAA